MQTEIKAYCQIHASKTKIKSASMLQPNPATLITASLALIDLLEIQFVKTTF